MNVASESEPTATAAVADTPETLLDVATSTPNLSSQSWLERFCSEFRLNIAGIDTNERLDTQQQKHTSGPPPSEAPQTKRVSFGRGVQQSNSMPSIVSRQNEPAPMELELPGGIDDHLRQRPNFESDVVIPKATTNNAKSRHDVAGKYIQSTSASARSVFRHHQHQQTISPQAQKYDSIEHDVGLDTSRTVSSEKSHSLSNTTPVSVRQHRDPLSTRDTPSRMTASIREQARLVLSAWTSGEGSRACRQWFAHWSSTGESLDVTVVIEGLKRWSPFRGSQIIMLVDLFSNSQEQAISFIQFYLLTTLVIAYASSRTLQYFCIHRRHIYHVLSRGNKPTLNDTLPLANLLRIPDDFVSSLLDRFNVERYDVVDPNMFEAIYYLIFEYNDEVGNLSLEESADLVNMHKPSWFCSC